MKLVALIEKPGHVCYRYRVRPYQAVLAKHGIHVDVQPIARSPWQRLRQFVRLKTAHGVLLQRKLFAPWEIFWLRRHSRVLIYDVDDAVFQRDSFQQKPQQSSYRWLRFALTVRAADLILAGNTFLANQAKRCLQTSNSSPSDNPQRKAVGLTSVQGCEGGCIDSALYPADPVRPRVFVVPTCVDPSCYPVATHAENRSLVRLVWIGSGATLPSLEMAADWLREAARGLPNLLLRVVCDRLPPVAGLPMELWPWNEQSEALALATADIGLAWMPPDSWSQGKCGLKVLQYMAAGLPVVANPVGVHTAMVFEGKTGRLANNPVDWGQAIVELAASPQLRRSLGEAARRFVQEHYSVQTWAPRIAELLAATLEAGASPYGQSRPEGLARRPAASVS
jgi:hypothetical protein